jgi:uncharacterized protein YukE
MIFTVTAQDLNNFANYCDGQVEDIQGLVRTLQGQVQELETVYRGPAASQLQVDIISLGSESTRLQSAMSEITANLRHNALVYVDGETQNVSNLQAATAAINAGNSGA